VEGGEIPMAEKPESGGNGVIKIRWFGWLRGVKE
jgi:hypothetical protein